MSISRATVILPCRRVVMMGAGQRKRGRKINREREYEQRETKQKEAES